MSNEQPSTAAERPETRVVASPDPNGEAPARETPKIVSAPRPSDALSSPAGRDKENLAGRVLSDRYLVERCLGAGGMGAVWRAEHTLMKKTVAVKVLHSDVVGYGEAVERFRREAQAAAHIHHPNVCLATDFGEMEGGSFFLVMEYLEGITLDEALATADRFAPERAIHIVDQILAALSQAHQLGVVHRDLKPENIMLVERDGDPDFVKIMDFGIARMTLEEEPEDARLTRMGRVYGTPMYMSPEQATGATDIDLRADLYTVGVMLFEMLSGSLPFFDKSAAKIMAMHLTEDAPSVRTRAPAARLPKALDRLVRRLMAKDPADRPESADAVRAELGRIGQGVSTQTWVIVSRDAADAGVGAVRGVYQKVRPHAEAAREWVLEKIGDNRMVRALVLVGVILALAGIPLVAALVLLQPDSTEISSVDREELAKTLAEQRLQFLDKIDARDVINAMAMDDSARALERLDALIAEHESNAHLLFLHGRASTSAEQWTQALASYRRALKAQPDYAMVDRLVDDVVERYREGDSEQVQLAEAILLEQIPAAEGNRRLSALARMGKSSTIRKRAYAALKENDRLEKLQPWNRASIALRFARGCQSHRQHIEEIVAAEDPRGLEVLGYYDQRPRTGCGTFNRDDCYGCIRKDLSDAISKLSELTPPEAGAEARAEVDADAEQ